MRSLRLLVLSQFSSGVIFLAVPAVSQQPARTPNFLPIVPVIADLEYAPEYFIQWMKDDPRYAMIQALLYQREPLVCALVLTEKKSEREVYYSNSELKVKALKQRGKTARLAKIDFRIVERVGQQPIYGFGFADETGQAIRWRFIPTSAATRRGAGIGSGHIGRGLNWIYRNLGTAAGEGTAVQVGEKVSEAEHWPEISAPPYFVAYRGFYQVGAGMGGLLLGTESWRVTSKPKELREGA
ncbi:MAG TPA: hypothetical protein VFV34_07925, partial [Blastocatellia bacterium]|nr:hypothetical protein [Blastocatellia bacterium]